MVNIFCTKKLESFVKTEERTLESYTSENNWNGQLISIDRKKCLFFIHKRTLYSFLILDVLKKDLLNIEELFRDRFLSQLKDDNLYNSNLDNYFNGNFNHLNFFRTDNDKKTIGTLNEVILSLKAQTENAHNKIEAAKLFMKGSLNRIPLGSSKFTYATEMMEMELKNNLI